MTTTVTVTEARDYRQEYRRLGPGERGYRRRVTRVSDGAEMYAGPGTGVDHPPRRHPAWRALPREERRAVEACLDAEDEVTGAADYLSERAGRRAVESAVAARGVDQRPWSGAELEEIRRTAAQREYEAVLALRGAPSGVELARRRLDEVTRTDRDAEATRRVAAAAGARSASALFVLATDAGALRYEPRVRWVPAGDPAWRSARDADAGSWAVGAGLVPLGLANLTGLGRHGEIGLPLSSGRAAHRDAAHWRRLLAEALPGASPAPEDGLDARHLLELWSAAGEADLGRPPTHEEYDRLSAGAPVRLLYGEDWVDAEVLGRVGAHLHVAVRRASGVVGYTLTWTDARRMLRTGATGR